MTNTQAPPVVSLQAPKDVSISQVELELSKIWQAYGENAAARATTFNLLIYEPEELTSLERMASIDAIASQSPCRVIDLLPIHGEDEGITAQVAAYCPIQKTRSSLVCGEYITLQGTKDAFNRVHALIADLIIPDLPVFLWWKDSPAPNTKMFERLINLSDRLIFDSAVFTDSETSLVKKHEMIHAGAQVADLNWQRLAPWQELTAQAFDPPDRRAAIWDVDGITIDYERGNSTQALMFLGWIASRLDWKPVARFKEGGDYDIQRITFTGKNDLKVEAELAAIPTADPGEVVGDLIGLRLTSTNLNADACNVFCSESTGCMRMEAAGGAQACHIHQVTPLSDQSADTLMGQQLQRWGRDMLYEESLTVTAQILSL
ncbi:glucose-6-phosphate dehydrogenase assembly protein OpcA [Tumidithrix elongata RA019]|uniref:Glucose-6-phosphate dehydrogenase assembly protein OpcA n=1 Tax=Tumidithrix elongata BACA0141 TaxID=2716417 RepID=A0AAW9PUR7_9CYAN|nr:glucose-6-phosphate dehydrogenase assembly protein OpcA [Tumidithrix elongata RA019]